MTALTIEPGRYSCPVCKRQFTELASKKKHMRLKHDRKPKAVR